MIGMPNIFGSYAGQDKNAIHGNTAAEINVITEKTTPIDADLVIIEDSADVNNKKKVLLGNLPGTYTDRGDVASAYVTSGSLTKNGAWHDLDLSESPALTGAGPWLVNLEIDMKAAEINKNFVFKTKGNSNAINTMRDRTKIANQTVNTRGWVYTDANGLVEYNIDTATWASFNLIIRGAFNIGGGN